MTEQDLKGLIASDLIIVATETKGKMPSKLNFTELIDVVTDVVKNCSIPDVSQQRELLDAFCCTMEFDVKHETYEEDINYFLENVKADNCG